MPSWKYYLNLVKAPGAHSDQPGERGETVDQIYLLVQDYLTWKANNPSKNARDKLARMDARREEHRVIGQQPPLGHNLVPGARVNSECASENQGDPETNGTACPNVFGGGPVMMQQTAARQNIDPATLNRMTNSTEGVFVNNQGVVAESSRHGGRGSGGRGGGRGRGRGDRSGGGRGSGVRGGGSRGQRSTGSTVTTNTATAAAATVPRTRNSSDSTSTATNTRNSGTSTGSGGRGRGRTNRRGNRNSTRRSTRGAVNNIEVIDEDIRRGGNANGEPVLPQPGAFLDSHVGNLEALRQDSQKFHHLAMVSVMGDRMRHQHAIFGDIHSTVDDLRNPHLSHQQRHLLQLEYTDLLSERQQARVFDAITGHVLSDIAETLGIDVGGPDEMPIDQSMLRHRNMRRAPLFPVASYPGERNDGNYATAEVPEEQSAHDRQYHQSPAIETPTARPRSAVYPSAVQPQGSQYNQSQPAETPEVRPPLHASRVTGSDSRDNDGSAGRPRSASSGQDWIALLDEYKSRQPRPVRSRESASCEDSSDSDEDSSESGEECHNPPTDDDDYDRLHRVQQEQQLEAHRQAEV